MPRARASRVQDCESLTPRPAMRACCVIGQPEQSHALLVSIYNWLSVGFDTAPIRRTRVLLDEPRSSRQRLCVTDGREDVSPAPRAWSADGMSALQEHPARLSDSSGRRADLMARVSYVRDPPTLDRARRPVP